MINLTYTLLFMYISVLVYGWQIYVRTEFVVIKYFEGFDRKRRKITPSVLSKRRIVEYFTKRQKKPHILEDMSLFLTYA